MAVATIIVLVAEAVALEVVNLVLVVSDRMAVAAKAFEMNAIFEKFVIFFFVESFGCL